MITLPGLIDIHVHLRTPGQEDKEDFLTGTQAALAGGFTTVLDMPNNKEPITTLEKLQQKMALAQKNIVCDVGFYFGSLGDNLEQLGKIKNLVFGIKLYLNVTTGQFLINEDKLRSIYQSWPSPQPILLHCEGETMPMALKVIRSVKKKTHICHVSSQDELSQIIEAKSEGLPITCGVTPHHLFLTKEDVKKLGPYGLMKPYLKSKEGQQFLWDHLDQIDVVESDHAPHTKAEKQSDNPPFGVPGLETTLPLLLTAVSEGKLTIEDIERLLYINPKKIFNIPTDESTYIEIDETITYNLEPRTFFTKCKWSSFEGKKVKGKVKAVYLRGQKVFDSDLIGVENGQILAKPGSGRIIFPTLNG